MLALRPTAIARRGRRADMLSRFTSKVDATYQTRSPPKRVELAIIDSIGRIEFTSSSLRLYGFSCKSLDTAYNNLEKNHVPADKAQK